MDMESQIVVLGCLIQEFNVCAIVLQMLFVNFIKFLVILDYYGLREQGIKVQPEKYSKSFGSRPVGLSSILG